MKHNNSIDIPVAISGTEYVAPDYGYFAVSIDADNVTLNGLPETVYKANKGEIVKLEYENLHNVEYFKFIIVDEPVFNIPIAQTQQANIGIPFDKPVKPDSFLPSQFGGVKNNFSDELIANGYQDSVPAVLGGGNLNWLIDNMGKTMTYYTKIADYFCSLGIGKTPWISKDNKFSETQFGFRVFSLEEEYQAKETVVKVFDDDTYATYVSLKDNNMGHDLEDKEWWILTGFNIRPATTEILGGVIPDGDSILVDNDGRISANIKVDGKTINMDDKGVISINPATSDKLGGIMPDEVTTTVNEQGVLSVIASAVLAPAYISEVGSNYIKISNGLIIQWGSNTINRNETKTISFNVSFSSTNYFVFANFFQNADIDDNVIPYRNNETTFAVRGTQAGANDSWSNVSFAWLAIGV